MNWKFSPPKYRAVPTVLDGFRFSSKVEAAYYAELLLHKKAGVVLHIDVHPVFTLGPGDRVKLDFLVWNSDGTVDGIDIKGAWATTAAKEFRRMAKRWNHPAVALKAVARRKNKWVDWEAPTKMPR